MAKQYKSGQNDRKSDNKVNNNKPSDRKISKDRDMDKRGKGNVPMKNDWKFYTVNEEVAKQIANVPFNVMTGMPLKWSLSRVIHNKTDRVTPSGYENRGSASLLGIIKYVPTIGVGKSATTGINMAAVQLYTYVRHANSGAKNYDAADLMMYILAMRDMYSTYFEIRRTLTIVQSYFYENRGWPDAILQGLHLDYEGARANFAQYVARLNILGYKINSFAVPKYFKAFERAAYISSLVFGDSDSIRGQAYLFSKTHYYVWDTTSSESGTMLKAKFMPTESFSQKSIGDLLDVLEEQLNALYLDTDALTMSGDILKAFGEGDLYSVQPMTTADKIAPIMDEDILAQIENCNVLGGGDLYRLSDPLANPSVTYDLDITQKLQLIEFKPAAHATSNNAVAAAVQDFLFNSHKNEPDYKDVLEWTRLMHTSTVSVSGTSPTLQADVTVTSCGLELVLNILIIRNNYDPTSGTITVGKYDFKQVQESTTNLSAASFAPISQFDWHPTVYFCKSTSASVQGVVEAMCDMKVPTIIPEDIVEKINDCAVHAAFYFG